MAFVLVTNLCHIVTIAVSPSTHKSIPVLPLTCVTSICLCANLPTKLCRKFSFFGQRRHFYCETVPEPPMTLKNQNDHWQYYYLPSLLAVFRPVCATNYWTPVHQNFSEPMYTIKIDRTNDSGYPLKSCVPFCATAHFVTVAVFRASGPWPMTQ